MAFTPQPMFPGPFLDAATRLAADIEAPYAKADGHAARLNLARSAGLAAVEAGWPAIWLDEASGGIGGSFTELAAVAEASGAHASPLAVPGACMAGPRLLQLAGAPPALLRQVAAGEVRLCPIFGGLLANSDPAAPFSGDGGVLNGALFGIEVQPDPTHLLVALDGALHLIAAAAASVTYTERLDGRFAARVAFDGVKPDQTYALAQAAVDDVWDLCGLLVAVEAVGAMGPVIEQTIAYLSTRVQFDVTLSTFQVLRHRTVDMYVAYLSTRELVARCVAEVDAGIRDPRLRSLAKVRAGIVGRDVAKGAIQLHGGIGMTEELPAGALAKRLLMIEFEYGDSLARIGALAA